MTPLLRHTCAILLGAALAACDSNTTGIDNVDIGRFAGDVSGDVDARISGSASSTETVQGFHDLILLVDGSRDAEVLIYHADDEFFEGRSSISSNLDLSYDNGIVAEILIAGRYFIATGGTLDLDDVSGAGIDGTARFEAVELDEFDEPIFESRVTVDVAFRTDFEVDLGFDRVTVEARGASAKAPR